MGLAALFGVVLILLAILAIILYATYVGFMRCRAFVWRVLWGKSGY